METLRVGPGDEHIHVPIVDGLVAVASAELASGEAIVLGGSELPVALVLRVRTPARERTADGPLVSFDVADAVDRPHSMSPYRQYAPTPSGGRYFWSRDAPPDVRTEQDAPIESDDLEHEVRRRIERPTVVLGTRLVVRAGPEARDEIRREIDSLLPAPVPTYAVELRSGLVPKTAIDEAPVDAADSLPTIAHGVVRAGDTLVLVGGTQRRYVKDYDLYTSTGAHVSAPSVDDVFDGLHAWVRVLPVDHATVDLQQEVRRTWIVDPGAPLSDANPGTEFPGMSFPRTRSFDSWSDEPVELGTWIRLRVMGEGKGVARVLDARITRTDR